MFDLAKLDMDTALAIRARLGDAVVPDSVTEGRETENTFVARVLTESRCTMAVFRYLDEAPGEIGYEGPFGEWHHRLRRFRNTGTEEEFEAIRAGEVD